MDEYIYDMVQREDGIAQAHKDANKAAAKAALIAITANNKT